MNNIKYIPFAIASILIAFLLAPALLSMDETKATSDSINESKQPRSLVLTMTIEGAIGVVTNDRIADAIEQATDEKAELLVIILDTPGGFTKPTWTICKNILNSPVPVAMYIAPSGAKAGSAGVYMTYASHFAAMAPSTNIGAAHPVGGGGEEIDSVMNEKITNDAVAGIKASAEKHGRNKEWAEQSVRESVSITDSEALELNVINIRAENLADLLDQINGRTTDIPSGEKTMNLVNPKVVEIEMTFAEQILKILSSPDIAFLLFSLGGLGLMMELYHPGSIFPGAVGAVCLILAFYSFEVLPINIAGVGLIMLAIVFFILEVKIASYGLLTIGGLISIFFGGLMLVDTVDPTLAVSKSMLLTVVLIVGLIVGLLVWLVLRTASRQVATGNESMIGKKAQVRKDGYVYVDGALWKAKAATDLNDGDQVEIYAVDKLTLLVKPIN